MKGLGSDLNSKVASFLQSALGRELVGEGRAVWEAELYPRNGARGRECVTRDQQPFGFGK